MLLFRYPPFYRKKLKQWQKEEAENAVKIDTTQPFPLHLPTKNVRKMRTASVHSNIKDDFRKSKRLHLRTTSDTTLTVSRPTSIENALNNQPQLKPRKTTPEIQHCDSSDDSTEEHSKRAEDEIRFWDDHIITPKSTSNLNDSSNFIEKAGQITPTKQEKKKNAFFSFLQDLRTPFHKRSKSDDKMLIQNAKISESVTNTSTLSGSSLDYSFETKENSHKRVVSVDFANLNYKQVMALNIKANPHNEEETKIGSFSPPSAFEDIRDAEYDTKETHYKQGTPKIGYKLRNNATSNNSPSDKSPSKCIKEPLQIEKKQVNEDEEFECKEEESNLSKLLIFERRISVSSPVRGVRRNGRTVIVQVFIPYPPKDTHCKVSICISERSIGVQLIQVALTQFMKQTGLTLNNTNPEQYIIRAATKDGIVDVNTPAFDRTGVVTGIGYDSFVLVLDETNRNELVASTDGDTESNQESSNEHCNKLDDVLFEVFRNNSLIPILIPIAPDVLIRDVIKIFASKLDFDVDDYVLKFIVPNGTAVFLPEHLKLKTVKFVLVRRVLLVPKNGAIVNTSKIVATSSATSGVTEDSTKEDDLLLLPHQQITYREYKVIKVNKYGMRQERILGIDEKKIYNKLAFYNSGFLGISHKQTRVPEKSISSLISLTTTSKNQLTFILTFDDGELLHYEARTQVEALEIVTTLKLLLRLKEQEKKMQSMKKGKNYSLMPFQFEATKRDTTALDI